MGAPGVVRIEEGDTLQYTTARDAEDERHICPLQTRHNRALHSAVVNPAISCLTRSAALAAPAMRRCDWGVALWVAS